MSDSPSFPTVQTTVRTVSADTVFAVLGDPTRRRILLAMTDRKPHRAKALSTISGKRFDATLKHIIALRDAGFITAEYDPADGRRQLYTLSPSIKITDAPEGRTMDFGYCIVRVIQT